MDDPKNIQSLTFVLVDTLQSPSDIVFSSDEHSL